MKRAISLFLVPPLWLIVCGLAVACWPVFSWWVARMSDGSDDPLGFAALVAAGFFLWQRRREIEVSEYGLWMALGIIAVQAVLPLPPLIRGGSLVAALAVALALPKRHGGIVVLLFLSLPVVASLQYFLGYPLRLVTAEISRILLWCLGLNTGRIGTLLVWKSHEVGVDAACSGIKMLWAAFFVAGALAARESLTWKRTGVLLMVGLVLTILLNGVRSTILFFPEAKLVVWPEWTHEGIGIGLFIMVAASLVLAAEKLRQPARPISPAVPKTLRPTTVLAWSAVVIISAALAVVHRYTSPLAQQHEMPTWAGMFEGERLNPVPLSDAEAHFAAGFPGHIQVFRTASGRTLIFRQLTQATRQLHSSADCLKAAGYEVTPEPNFKDDIGRCWGSYKVSGAGTIHHLREMITDAEDRTFADPSAWFWPALLGQSNGPWTAISVLE